jgi:hypothetical protein
MLGRFVLPTAKLEEFQDLARGALGPSGGEAWPLSLVLSPEPGKEIERIDSFAREWEGRVRVASVEAPPLEASRIRSVAARIPSGLQAFFEVPIGPGFDARLAAVAACGAGAKVRTGGPKEDSFPSPAELSRFLCACARAKAPFKATAGLHHPFRGKRRLDDDPGSPAVAMHGFLNLAVLASLIRAGKAGSEEARQVLEESSPEAFCFLENGIEWRDRRVDLKEIAEGRRLFRSFGSCSFEEPVMGLEAHIP